MDESGLKMHEIVELFAEDQQSWITEFIPVFEKMQQNGYASGALTTSPGGWEGLMCNKKKCQPFSTVLKWFHRIEKDFNRFDMDYY